MLGRGIVYKMLFVSCEHEGYGIINVSNDGWHVAKFDLGEDWNDIDLHEVCSRCQSYLDSPAFEAAIMEQRRRYASWNQ
jgi:hypothetical protein